MLSKLRALTGGAAVPLALFAALALVAAGGFEPGAEPAAAQTRNAEQVSFSAPLYRGGPDEISLSATLHHPDQARSGPAPGVILLHGEGGDRTRWSPLVNELTGLGYVVLAPDLRGHGRSAGPGGMRHAEFTEREWSSLRLDVRTAESYLAARDEINGNRLALIGAGVGANLALERAATAEHVRTGIGLSPLLGFPGLDPQEAVRGYPEKGLLVLAARDDRSSAESARELAGLAAGSFPKKLKLYSGAARGTELLDTQPGTAGLIQNWLLNNLMF